MENLHAVLTYWPSNLERSQKGSSFFRFLFPISIYYVSILFILSLFDPFCAIHGLDFYLFLGFFFLTMPALMCLCRVPDSRCADHSSCLLAWCIFEWDLNYSTVAQIMQDSLLIFAVPNFKSGFPQLPTRRSNITTCSRLGTHSEGGIMSLYRFFMAVKIGRCY